MWAELAGEPATGVIITDLGLRAVGPRTGTPTLVVDHHLPQAAPEGIKVIAGHADLPLTAEQKGWIVAESLSPGAQVSEVARTYGVTPQHLFLWQGD